eukprot:319828_1
MAFQNTVVEMLLILVFCSKFINSLEVLSPNEIQGVYFHIKGHFGDWNVDSDLSYNVVIATPDLAACTQLFADKIKGNVVLILRGASIINNIAKDSNLKCSFSTKVLYAQQAGAVAVIIGNNVGEYEIMSMHDDKKSTYVPVTIPSMSVSKQTYEIMFNQIVQGENVTVKINNKGSIDDSRLNRAIEGWVTAILSTLLLLASVSLIIAGILSVRIFTARIRYLWNIRQRGLRIHMIKTVKYSSDLLIARKWISNEIVVSDIEFDTNQHEEKVNLIGSPIKCQIGNNTNENKETLLHNETCNVCLDDFVEGEEIKLLNCKHAFHEKCIKTWIIQKGECPVCKRDAFAKDH